MKVIENAAPFQIVVLTGARASVLLLSLMFLMWWLVVGALSMLVRVQNLPPNPHAPPVRLTITSLHGEVDASAKIAAKPNSEASTSSTPGISPSNVPVPLDVLAERVANLTSGTPSKPGYIGCLLLAALSCNVDVGAKLDRSAHPATPTLPTPPRSLAEAVDVAAKTVETKQSAPPTASPHICPPCVPRAPRSSWGSVS
jgi:hypothetical protein